MQDRRGNPVSRGSAEALDAYDSALHQLNIYCGDPIGTIDAAIAAEPDFVMGHLLRAEIFLTMWERGAVAMIQESLDKIENLLAGCTDRERAHVDALKTWVAGDWRGFQARMDRLLTDHPRDLLALQIGHLADFYNGDRDNLRGRVTRALPAWSAEDPGYAYVLGMLAFGQEECGAYAEAEEIGHRALALAPDDSWAQHAIAHVMEMQARQAEGIAFMESRTEHWAQPANLFAHHNWWHTGLFFMDQGQTAPALEIYDAHVRPAPQDAAQDAVAEMQVMLLDGVAFLWRMHLRGLDVGERWTELADRYEAKNDADGEAGFYVFNDMHAMMALSAAGRDAAAEARVKVVETAADGAGSNGAMTAQVGLPIVRAVLAFSRGDYDAAVEQLMPVRYGAHAFGGSHAQRDIVHRTLIEAAIRAGDAALARGLAEERVAMKPDCPFSLDLRERARAA